MKRTSVFSLLTLIVIGLIGGWYFFKATENQGNSVPELPWSTAPLLIAFAGLIFILARYISAKFSERDQDRKPLPVKRPADRKSTRLNSSHIPLSRMPSSA